MHFQGKRPALAARLHVERRFYHNRYHNGHSLEVPREEIVEAHGGLAVHGGGDVDVGVGGLRGRERDRVHCLNNSIHGKKRVWEQRGKEI